MMMNPSNILVRTNVMRGGTAEQRVGSLEIFCWSELNQITFVLILQVALWEVLL